MVLVSDDRQIVVLDLFTAGQGPFHEASTDADAFGVLFGFDNLFAIRGALIELVATAIEADLVGHGHEDWIFFDPAQGFSAFFLFTFTNLLFLIIDREVLSQSMHLFGYFSRISYMSCSNSPFTSEASACNP